MTYGSLLRIAATAVVGFTLVLSATPDKPSQPNSVKALRKKAWDILWEGTHAESTSQRSKATQALGLLSGEPAVAGLAEHQLQDNEADVRAAAATALGEMHSTASIPKLQNALSDKSISVAMAAARSLLHLKNDSGYEIYYAVLTGKRKTGENLIAEQLDEFKDPKKLAEFGFYQGIGFVPYAGYGLEVVRALTKNESSPLRAAAATVLAHDPDPRSGKALAEAVSDKQWLVRAAALKSIAMRGDPALLPYVEPAMSDHEDVVRYTAAASVLRLARPVQADKKQR
jgi:HEAT repeat protein